MAVQQACVADACGGRSMTEEPSVLFSAVLRQARDSAGLTQDELARAAGIGSRTISDLERGVAVKPRPSTVRRLAAALGLRGDDLARFEAAARRARPGSATAPGANEHGPGSPESRDGAEPRFWLRRIVTAL